MIEIISEQNKKEIEEAEKETDNVLQEIFSFELEALEDDPEMVLVTKSVSLKKVTVHISRNSTQSFRYPSHRTRRNRRCFKIFVILARQRSPTIPPSSMMSKNFLPISRKGHDGRYWQGLRLKSHLAFTPMVLKKGSLPLQTKTMIWANP